MDTVLNISNAENLSNASYSIVNVLGVKVLKAKIVNNNAIDMSNLRSGIYILSLSSEEGAKQFKF